MSFVGWAATQPTVQITYGSLTRPVRGYKSHDDAGHCEEGNDDEGSLHHISVPLILPSMILMAMAIMNMPASI